MLVKQYLKFKCQVNHIYTLLYIHFKTTNRLITILLTYVPNGSYIEKKIHVIMDASGVF